MSGEIIGQDAEIITFQIQAISKERLIARTGEITEHQLEDCQTCQRP